MKKVNCIILVVIVTMILTGCGADNTTDFNNIDNKEHKNEIIENYIKDNHYIEIEFECDSNVIENIYYVDRLSVGQESFLVTDLGEIYRIGKKYSNGKNCIQVEKTGEYYPIYAINHFMDQQNTLRSNYSYAKSLYK